jgi:hypothetical protein
LILAHTRTENRTSRAMSADARPPSSSRARGAILCALGVVALFSLVAVPAASQRVARELTPGTTEIHRLNGKLVATIPNGEYGASGECWIEHVNRQKILVGITHDTFGRSVRSSTRRRWNVWVKRTLFGAIKAKAGGRWDLYRFKQYNIFGVKVGPIGHVGYTRGADPVGVGTAFITLGICE